MKDLTKSELEEMLADALAALCVLESRVPNKSKVKKVGRKEQVYAILKRDGHVAVSKIAAELDIKAKNASSQLHYLRADGVPIGTDSLGRKFIES